MRYWLVMTATALSLFIAVLVGLIGADRFLRKRLSNKRERAWLEDTEGGDIGRWGEATGWLEQVSILAKPPVRRPG